MKKIKINFLQDKIKIPDLTGLSIDKLHKLSATFIYVNFFLANFMT